MLQKQELEQTNHTMLASINAYSKSVFPETSWYLRNGAFCTSRYRATWTGSDGGRWGRRIVSKPEEDMMKRSYILTMAGSTEVVQLGFDISQSS